MDVVITGASGMIGSALVADLEADGHRAIRLVRRAPQTPEEIRWDPTGGEIDTAGLEGADAVVNLAGPGIGDKRWTDARKQELRGARIDGTALLATALAGLDHRPDVLVSGSAIGYYGDRADELLDEQSTAGDDFLADLCRDWEAAASPAAAAGIRVATIRTGIVLAPGGGALEKLLPLFKLGLGGRMGSGRQYWSWITLEDQVRAIRHLIDREVSGPVNLTAPAPATNQELTETLGEVLHRPTFFPVPRFGPKLLIGHEAAETFLYASQRVLPKVLEADGFTFTHADLESDCAPSSVVVEPTPGRNVAAFDFDGTITRRDTLVPFLRRLRGPARFSGAFAAAAPVLAGSGGREAYKAAVLRRLLAGVPADHLATEAQDYATGLPRQFRPEIVDRIRWHQAEGHEVVIVSASLRAYLDPVVEHLGLDGVCAVELEVGEDGRLTGRMVGPNCRGVEKVRRLTSWLGGDTPERLWAYGNSSGDRELLAAAHEPTWVGRRG